MFLPCNFICGHFFGYLVHCIHGIVTDGHDKTCACEPCITPVCAHLGHSTDAAHCNKHTSVYKTAQSKRSGGKCCLRQVVRLKSPSSAALTPTRSLRYVHVHNLKFSLVFTDSNQITPVRACAWFYFQFGVHIWLIRSLRYVHVHDLVFNLVFTCGYSNHSGTCMCMILSSVWCSHVVGFVFWSLRIALSVWSAHFSLQCRAYASIQALHHMSYWGNVQV
jgi:hypothetical protein